MLDFLLTHTPILYLTQSIWRDEAFSILVASRPLAEVLPKLTFEPPVYYILLHFWLKIFGTSEIAARSLSLIGFVLATIIVIFWAEHIFKKSWLSWFLPLFFFLNPLLLYYAFEVRTYGWYTFFAVASMYTYLTKKHRWYILVAILGFYTHTYFLFTLAAQGVHFLISRREWLSKVRSFSQLLSDKIAKSFLIIALIISPWLLYVLSVSTKLKNSWYYPVDAQLVKSVLGNLFLGYEGTPWFLWRYTAWLSLGLIILYAVAFRIKSKRLYTNYFLIAVFFPLTVVIGISFIKPLYVNRYVLPVTIAQIFLIVFALSAIKKPLLQKMSGIALIAALLWFHTWYPPYIKKLPIRNTLVQINNLQRKDDLIFATSSLVYFESAYYAQRPETVYLYNPGSSAFPWYVGDAVFDQKRNVSQLPVYPSRAFMIKDDGTFTIAYQSEAPAKPK